MNDNNTHVATKLNFYALKCQDAKQKFDMALSHQKRFMKAVTKMRYEFNNRLSAVDKKLLDQESPLNLCEKSVYDSDFMDRIQHPKHVLYCTRHHYAKLQLFTIKRKQYQLLAGPYATSDETIAQAAKLARDAVAYASRWAKYLDYPAT